MYFLIAKLMPGLSEIMRQFKRKILKKMIPLPKPYKHAWTQALRKWGGGGKLFEVGCGEGKRLHWITENLGLQCYGVEPSEKAVALARTKTVQVIQGTADRLDFENQTFDFVVFGFCLYLCDRDDLFQIAKEAHRVLKPNGWVVVHDFFAETPVSREYHHLPGLFSYKMDYRKLFDWHPDYACLSHTISAHGGNSYTDDQNEWVATSVIRKKSQNE